MGKFSFKEQWARYTARKTKAGIVIDFFFIFLFIGMVIPSSRKVITSNVIRYTMSRNPKTDKENSFLTKADGKWKLESPSGEIIKINDLEDKVLFINFWATWCPPCIAEMPKIQKLYSDYGDRVVFLMVSGEDFSTTQAFLEDKNYTFPHYKLKDQLPKVFSTTGIPATFIVSKRGEVVMSKEGAANWNSDNIRTFLDQLIQE